MGSLNYQPVTYSIDDKEYVTKLSSQALSMHFNADKLILLIPESLATMLTNDLEECHQLLSDLDKLKSGIGKQITGRFDLKNFKAVPIQSLGVYIVSTSKVYFLNHIDNIISSDTNKGIESL